MLKLLYLNSTQFDCNAQIPLFYGTKVFCFMDRFNLGLITSEFDFLAFKVDLIAITLSLTLLSSISI